MTQNTKLPSLKAMSAPNDKLAFLSRVTGYQVCN
jgi:hypothetical protein